MINLPFVSMPEHFVRLLTSNVQNSTAINNNLEIYFTENKDLNVLIKRIFKDIDPDGFLGKIISISGWAGIRNRLAGAFIDFAKNGSYPYEVNVSSVNEIINIENKLRHFTNTGHSRAFLLAFYAKLSMIRLNKMEEVHNYSPLIIKDEHIDLMKYSKSKSVRIDWLILQIALFENILGITTLTNLMKSEVKFQAILNMLSEEEQSWFMENLMTYGASISDFEFFLTDISLSA
jgi:hypothetical protein